MSISIKLLVLIIVAIVIIAGGLYYYFYILPPKKIKISLYTKAGLWADFIREMKIIEKFRERMLREKNIDVEVEMITRPHKGYRDTLVADLAAGTVGDVIWIGDTEIPGSAEAGHLLDLTPYVTKWDRWKKFFPVGKKLVTVKGKVYAVPFETAPLVIFYRKDIFERAGIPIPWQPESWEDIYEAARIIKEKVPDIVPINPMYGIELPIFAAGGIIYDPKDGKFIVKSDAILACFKYYYEVFHARKLAPVELWLEKWDTRKYFQEAKLAITVDGTWCWREKWGPGMPYEIRDIEKVVGYALFPGSGTLGAPKYISLTGAYCYAIWAKSKHKDIAWELLKELVKPEYMAEWGYRTSHLVTAEDAMIGKYAEDPFLKWAAEVLKHSLPKPLIPGVKKYLTLLKRVVIDYLLPEAKTPEECMDIFAEMATKELGADKVKALPPYKL